MEKSHNINSSSMLPKTPISQDPQVDTLFVFNKFKSGSLLFQSAFKLYSTDGSCSEDDSPESSIKIRGSYRKYTKEEKEKAVERIVQGEDVKMVAAELEIPMHNLLRWKKHGCERKEGGGRPADQELEVIIYDKIRKNEIKGEKEIRAAAKLASKCENFKASKGWFSKFRRRYKVQTGLDL